MKLLCRALMVLCAFGSAAPLGSAQGSSNAIRWSKDLQTAFAEAKKEQKILMICVNAKYVDGKQTEERANKGLREVVYKDQRVIAASSRFVCALITPASGSSEFGELRLLGIEGALVAPQHIFVHPDGGRILLRKEYWSHGKGDKAVKALLELMNRAHEKLDGAGAEAPPADDDAPAEGAPESGPEREAWIAARVAEVVAGPKGKREPVVATLARSDKGGDCVTPLIALFAEHKKNLELVVALIRGLGRDQLHDASEAIVPFLTHKNEAVRGNAAVSLEYIGTRDPKIVAALLRAAGKEKDESIANHMYRAAGRCGIEDSKARTTLLKRCGSSKTEFASYGPAVGLAYMEGNAKAARGVEKIIKKIGIPGGRRGGGQNTVKRGVFCWTLAEIGDPKSAKFVQDQLVKKLENVQAFWVGPLKSFYRNVAKACDGDANAKGQIPGGVRGFVMFARNADPDRYDREARSMMDQYRKGRDDSGFTPKGDYLLGSGDE